MRKSRPLPSTAIPSAGDYSVIGSGILEVEGVDEVLPFALRPLLQLGARALFSEFLAVYQHAARRIV